MENHWKCVQCNYKNDMVFSSCLGCNAYRSKSLKKEGDWNCSLCGKLNFAYRNSCIKCAQSKVIKNEISKPHISKKPGDWDCSWCHKMNFGKRDVCFTCGKPKEKKDNTIQEKDNTCTVCMDNDIDTCITTCGHLACCYLCAAHMQKCPICRTEYDPDNTAHLVKVYHAK